jgi:hypothetical protein
MKRRNGLILLLIGLISFSGWAALGQDFKGSDKKGRENGPGRESPEKHRDAPKGLSPEEREAKRKEMQERIQKQLTELRKKKADGTLSPVEKKRLDRMEEVAKRMEQNQSGAEAGGTNKPPRDNKRSGEK